MGREKLTAADGDEVEQFQSKQFPGGARRQDGVKQRNHWSPGFPEGDGGNFMRQGWMVGLEDAVNIVGGIGRDENVSNREDYDQSQRDSRPPHHWTTFIAMTLVGVKVREGRAPRRGSGAFSIEKIASGEANHEQSEQCVDNGKTAFCRVARRQGPASILCVVSRRDRVGHRFSRRDQPCRACGFDKQACG